MTDLKYFQNKIKQKRKQTNFRDFLMEIWSWTPLVYYKNELWFSRYPDTSRVQIKKDNWENTENIKDYLSDKWFFNDFQKLFLETPLDNIIQIGKNENTRYADMIINSKNVYLSSWIARDNENILYSFRVREFCKNVFNSIWVVSNSNNVYSCVWISNSFNIFYSSSINNSNNIYFSSNLTWCTECILCNDLENSSYYIENKKYSKKDYLVKKEEILKDKKNYLKLYKKVDKNWKKYNTENVTWTNITESENIENGNFIFNCKNWRNIMYGWSNNDGQNWYDSMIIWKWIKDIYGVNMCWANSSNIYNSLTIGWSHNIMYSMFLETCSYCIWCIWLKNKSYCILNKQYTKKEWEILADKIFTKMENDWILWDFFPWEINPFYFNDTIAGILWNFSKETAEKKWYIWRNKEIKTDIPEWSDIITITDLNDYQWYNENWNWEINPEILKKVIVDEKGDYYRIVQIEYDFLMKHSLPLPEIHWMDRMELNLGV